MSSCETRQEFLRPGTKGCVTLLGLQAREDGDRGIGTCGSVASGDWVAASNGGALLVR